MDQEPRKRSSTNPDSESAWQGRKKFKFEIYLDSLNSNSDILSLADIFKTELSSEHEQDSTYSQNDCSPDDSDQSFSFDKVQEDNFSVNYFKEGNMAITKSKDVFIVSKDKVLKHITRRYNTEEYIEQDSFVVYKKLTNDNILTKFQKMKFNRKLRRFIVKQGKDEVKPALVRSSLSRNCIRFIRKILLGYPKLIDRPFEGTGQNELQSSEFEKLRNFILSNKEILLNFNPLDEKLNVPKTKPKSDDGKGYNPFININQLIDYFIDPTIREVLHLYINFILAGVTSYNLETRVGFSPRDIESFNIEELRGFFKDLCSNVVRFKSSRKMIEGNVLTIVAEDGKVLNLLIEDKDIHEEVEVDLEKMFTERELEDKGQHDLDKTTQSCSSDVLGSGWNANDSSEENTDRFLYFFN